ncbi:tetratricopeptide repeat protein [Herbaspirillum robiniae]|uniref:Sel1 repeat family protein n=1 Tax=Herbaspirillum robiniae TaxID=2014887 RepID=A0A246WMN4_9BURK|nr:SEL1-like repeat protein [Herbaspirillum robiniae]OWY27619.1 hypothetical protein CEJ42_18850 [Herbaspirillum robiniae]
MATRNNLPIIRAARTGAATAQLALGTRYFFGKSGLPQSPGTAFYWLERAARQGLEDAFLMIGEHVPYDIVTTMSRPHEAAPWYEKAFDAGVLGAGLTFARLVLDNPRHFDAAARRKAVAALRDLAERDNHDAQWMLAQHLNNMAGPHDHPAAGDGPADLPAGQVLLQKAADAGIEAARYSLLEQAWDSADGDAYLAGAAPLAEALLQRHRGALGLACNEPQQAAALTLEPHEIGLLLRLAQVLQRHGPSSPVRSRKLLELAAVAGSGQARYQLGLLHACIDEDGRRTFPLYGTASYKKAVAWLLLSANGGHAPAWHALSHIYARSEFSHRDLPTSRRYLERAAEMGLLAAQFELANNAWRNRRDTPQGDISAIYWWQQAARQGHPGSREALQQFAPRLNQGAWAGAALDRIAAKSRKAHPFLCTRLELASAFGLTRPEALLLDVGGADHGHCLEVNIGQHHARSRRRLIAIDGAQQRSLMNLAGRLFGDVDCGYSGPEGNYRQRQYRLATLVGEGR